MTMEHKTSEKGFSLIGLLVAIGVGGVLAAFIGNMFQTQAQLQKTIEVQAKYQDIQNEIRNLINQSPDNCSCSFQGQQFSVASLPTQINWSGQAARLNYYEFTTPGDCSTASIARTLVQKDTVTEGIETVQLTVGDIISGGAANTYTGRLIYGGKSSSQILGSNYFRALDIPITFTATVSGGTATIDRCSATLPPTSFGFTGPGIGNTVSPTHNSTQTVDFGLPAGTKAVLISYQIGSLTGNPGSDREDRWCRANTTLDGSNITIYMGYNSRGDGRAHGVGGTAIIPLRSDGSFTLNCNNQSSVGVIRAMASVN